MKKTIKIMLTLAFVIVALSITAAATGTNGFYDVDLGDAANVTVKAYAGSTEITEKDADVDDDGTGNAYYEGSERIVVTYTGAEAEENYGVILVEGDELPTVSDDIYYINQEQAASTSIEFNVYPKTITAPESGNTRNMTLFISTSKAGGELVTVPMSYVVGYEGATYAVTQFNRVEGALKLEAAEAVEGKALVASYADATCKVMIDAVIVNVNAEANTLTPIDYSGLNTTGATYYKAMLWFDTENCKPLIDAYAWN